MTVIIVTLYTETLKQLIHENVDSKVIVRKGDRPLELMYVYKDDTLFTEYTLWLGHAQACNLIRSFNIVR